MLVDHRSCVRHSIAFAFVATHNHFVLDRGGKVFKQIGAGDQAAGGGRRGRSPRLLGLLNSSTACFWLKQVCHNKGSTVDQRGRASATAPLEDFFEFKGTKVGQFPLAGGAPLERARRLDELAGARTRRSYLPRLGRADAHGA